MWLQRTEVWQVFVHRRGASALRLDGAETAAKPESTRQVAAESAVDAWRTLESVLPSNCRLQVFLDSDVATLALIPGGEDLSERDWQALAEAHFRTQGMSTGLGRDETFVAIDTQWHGGKRAAIAVDNALLQCIRESRQTIACIVSHAAWLLTVAKGRAGEDASLLCVRDEGGWTLAAVSARTAATTKGCLALACYPANAAVMQIEVEASRMATASGLNADAKRIVLPARPKNVPTQLRPIFAFDLLQRTRGARAVAALCLVLFCAVVVALTQAWHEVDAQAQATKFKQRQLNELVDAIQQQVVPKLDTSIADQPIELRADWRQTFSELEALVVPNQGVTVTNFSAQAVGNVMRLSVEVKPDALERFYEALRKRTDGTWRVASINKARGDGVQNYQVLLVRGKTAEN